MPEFLSDTDDARLLAEERPGDNALALSVGELSFKLKRMVEGEFGHVRLRGEISGYKRAASGHVYLALKDDAAVIDGVMWKGQVNALAFAPQDGIEVIATGKLTTYPGRSKYQIVIERMELAGAGALMALFEKLKAKLAGEGLFDRERKVALPFLPRTIGVVTSPTGAVIRDILHRLEDRFPRHVLVWPVRVQGETSAAEVAAAIAGFNALPEGGRIPRPDVIIVARGGGSLEDLMGFNEEIVVRAAAASLIPLVSAVGHETDVTLIDHAADLRAPTPTGAAEKVVPVRAELMSLVADLARRQAGAMRRLFDRRRSDLRALARALPGPEAVLSGPRQRLDLASARLAPALARNARAHEQQLALASQRLARHSPLLRLATARKDVEGLSKAMAVARANILRRERDRIGRDGDRLGAAGGNLAAAFARLLQRRRDRLGSVWALAASLGPEAVLARGYALVRDETGSVIRDPGQLRAGQALGIQVAGGRFGVVVAGGGEGLSRSTRPPRRDVPKAGQGDLF